MSQSDDVSSDSELDSNDDSLFNSDSDDENRNNNSNDSMNKLNPEQYQYFYRYPRMIGMPHLGYNIEGPLNIDLLLQLMLDDEIDINTYEIRQKRFCECEYNSSVLQYDWLDHDIMKYFNYDQSYIYMNIFFRGLFFFSQSFFLLLPKRAKN